MTGGPPLEGFLVGVTAARKVDEQVALLERRGARVEWAPALSLDPNHVDDAELRARFSRVAKQLADHEAAILAELNAAQGKPVDIGGYFRPNPELASKAMRPSATLNAIVDAIS